MSANKKFDFGPIALTNVMTTNLLNPPTTAGGVNAGAPALFITLTQVRITNKTAAAQTFSLWKGASGANLAGTEIIGQTQTIAAFSSYDAYPNVRLNVADFLVGGASANTALTISGSGEIGVA